MQQLSSNGETIERKECVMSGEKPTHRAYVVEHKSEADTKQGFWSSCGVAWAHKDGKELNIQLAAGLAVSGRVVLREIGPDGERTEVISREGAAPTWERPGPQALNRGAA
jgi:hypothetical protein